MTHSKDLLADELRKIGLDSMAERAAAGWYHDFLSPLDTPSLQLDHDLLLAAESGLHAALKLRRRHHAGDFDATKEESNAWAKSPDGQATFAGLMTGGRRDE